MRAMLLPFVSVCAFAAFAADGGSKVLVTASASVDVVPTEFHVVLTFKQKGTDAKATLEALKKSREAALAKLPGIDPAKAKVETPIVVEKGGSNPMAAAMAMARGNRVAKKADDPYECILQQVVRVPVTFSGKDQLAITLEAEGMKAAVQNAKVMADAPEADDDETNVYAQMGIPQKKHGPIEFEFVAPRTPDVEQKGYDSALKAARDKAAQIAKAAGLKVVGVSLISLQEADKESSGAENPTMTYLRLMMGAMGGSAPQKASDVISGDSAALSLKVTLAVTFELAP